LLGFGINGVQISGSDTTVLSSLKTAYILQRESFCPEEGGSEVLLNFS
jgi:hypothetical protein